ncbi:hypothetical protein TNCV_4918421 [Trichonephila clavipes]|nr:hypothetical protein TNCV_4918421 [Trichonephila clavipes]
MLVPSKPRDIKMREANLSHTRFQVIGRLAAPPPDFDTTSLLTPSLYENWSFDWPRKYPAENNKTGRFDRHTSRG